MTTPRSCLLGVTELQLKRDPLVYKSLRDSRKIERPDPMTFTMEKHLEDFLVQNGSQTELGSEYDVYEEEGEEIPQSDRCQDSVLPWPERLPAP